MNLSRRGILIAGGSAVLAAPAITRAPAQQRPDHMGAMPGPEVVVSASAPLNAAPIADVIAAISSSSAAERA